MMYLLLRCADLNAPENVFAADIYCHRACFMEYVHLPKQIKFSISC